MKRQKKNEIGARIENRKNMPESAIPLIADSNLCE